MTETTLQRPAASGPEFRIGAVLRRAIGVYFRHVPIFLVLGAITALPNLLWQPYQAVGRPVAQSIDFGASGLLVLTWLILYPICQAMVLYGAFQDMRRRPVRLGETVQKALGRALPVVGVAVCVGIAVGFAMMLLVVPGLILYTLYAVALPVCVVERLGVFASMQRSAELTKGYRWRVFGLFLVKLVLSAVFGGILLALAELGGPLSVRITNFIWIALSSSFFSIVYVVAYHDLRVAKEGIDIERIAAVFD